MQAGVAEELVFRGFLFGHLRRQRTFWRAAAASLPPFLVAHLFLFFALPWPIALTAVGENRWLIRAKLQDGSEKRSETWVLKVR